MITLLSKIGITRIMIFDLWISFLDEGLARTGNRDAFYYKKSKTLIKKQMKQMNKFEKAFWVYRLELTNTQKYAKLFYYIRALNLFFVILYLALFAITKKYGIDSIVGIIIILRSSLVNGILLVINIISYMKGPPKGDPKAYNFD